MITNFNKFYTNSSNSADAIIDIPDSPQSKKSTGYFGCEKDIQKKQGKKVSIRYAAQRRRSNFVPEITARKHISNNDRDMHIED